MRKDFAAIRLDEEADALVSDSDLIGYFTPSEIVDDPMLTLARKRQLLAYWASDIHAVRNAPSLRSYAFGSAVPIDDIQAALVALDTMVDAAAIPASGITAVSA